MLNVTDTQSSVHTEGLSVELDNINTNKVDDDLKKCERSKGIKIDVGAGRCSFIMNVNNEERKQVTSLSEHDKLRDCKLKEYEVEDMSKVTLDRIDIAIDVSNNFDKDFRYFLYMFALCSNKVNQTWFSKRLKDMSFNAIRLNEKSFEMEFYDRRDKTNSSYTHNTRMEFRLKRLSSMDTVKHVNKVIKMVSDMHNNIDKVNEAMTKAVLSLYRKEKEVHGVKSLSAFVIYNRHYILTEHTLRALHKESGLTGSYANWFRKFKMDNPEFAFELFKKNDVKRYQAEVVKSLKKFRDS